MELILLQAQEAPDFILFLGRFHPLLLHLPIGFIFCAFLIEIWNKWKKTEASDETVRIILLSGLILTAVTALFGYFLSLEGGYGKDTLDIHKWSGIISTVLVGAVFILKKRSMSHPSNKKFYLPLFTILILTLSVTGHFGGTLTHGEDYISYYLPDGARSTLGFSPRKVNAELKLESLEGAHQFKDIVQPILENKCVSCHNSSKKKGELMLNLPENIMKGGDSGEAFIAGKPGESRLIEYINLPEEDELHMPPKGKKQLNKREIELLHWWIESGASFDAKLSELNLPESIQEILDKMVEDANRWVNPVFKLAVNKLNPAKLGSYDGYSARRIAQDNNLVQLRVEHLNSRIGTSLAEYKEQLTWLDLARSEVDDELMNGISEFKNITKLNLSQTKISDKTLEEISRLEFLESLNLFGTLITDEGIGFLKNNTILKNLYVWQTEVSELGISELKESLPELQVISGLKIEGLDTIPLASPIVEVDRNFFKDKATISAELRFEGVELYYTTDGSHPDNTDILYTGPFEVKESMTLKFIAHKEGWGDSSPTSTELIKVDRLADNATLVNDPSDQYAGSGPLTIIDMVKGSENFRDGKWLGFQGDDLIATIDMGESGTIKKVKMSYMVDIGAYIFGPTLLKVETSVDGSSWSEAGTRKYEIPKEAIPGGLITSNINVNKPSVRFIRVTAENIGICPDWHPGAGDKAWLFVDEIIIE